MTGWRRGEGGGSGGGGSYIVAEEQVVLAQSPGSPTSLVEESKKVIVLTVHVTKNVDRCRDRYHHWLFQECLRCAHIHKMRAFQIASSSGRSK